MARASEAADKPLDDGFGPRLRELRRQRNLSQSQLGEQVGIHYTHVGRYERGTSRPSAAALMRLADVLGVSGDYLIQGATDDNATARLADAELLRAFRDVEQLPAEDQAVIKRLLDAFLTRQRLEQLVAK
jgi:transcriptional regulator with XRE-family HTH domain